MSPFGECPCLARGAVCLIHPGRRSFASANETISNTLVKNTAAMQRLQAAVSDASLHQGRYAVAIEGDQPLVFLMPMAVASQTCSWDFEVRLEHVSSTGRSLC